MKEIKKLTGHGNVLITSRGNEAIEVALGTINKLTEKKVILIPDQGGWISYKELPQKQGFEIRELKTDKGVVVLDELKNNLKDVAGFLFTSFAGYYAEQPLEEISKICKEKGVYVIEDVSGSFGDEKLCNGNLSDFIVCSFGKWKIVDYGKYGFVSSNLDLIKSKSLRCDKDLVNRIKEAPKRLKRLLELSEKVKEELKGYEVFYKNKRGINVIVKYDGKNFLGKDSSKIIDYCKNKGYEYVLCPKSFKVMEKAISIELKRLK